jgi:hypothetical protein
MGPELLSAPIMADRHQGDRQRYARSVPSCIYIYSGELPLSKGTAISLQTRIDIVVAMYLYRSLQVIVIPIFGLPLTAFLRGSVLAI